MEATAATAVAGVMAGPSSSEMMPPSQPASQASPAQYDDTDSRHSSSHFAVKPSSVSMALSSSLGTGTSTSTPPENNHHNNIINKDAAAKAFPTRIHDEDNTQLEGERERERETAREGPRLRSSRMSKPIHAAVVVEKKKLLDLPVDILKDIVKEVTHTNDLTSLALCHSALHRLTIPHIYSRFDIVWPDSSTHAEPRSGVDALTYGLATLVMAEEIFGEAPNQRQHHNNRFNQGSKSERASEMAIRRRRGNHYAQFTKKFSLGNGPADWVQEYLISKEGGKMLGTLVALAVARMRSLETFIWDMPTGILRDVWLALSSLGDRGDGQACRLEKLWVRWHDNSSNTDHLQGESR